MKSSLSRQILANLQCLLLSAGVVGGTSMLPLQFLAVDQTQFSQNGQTPDPLILTGFHFGISVFYSFVFVLTLYLLFRIAHSKSLIISQY